ncbi:MAG: hypothetical protein JXN59_07640 [Anaerolineae bacterium]|nr:hypothetical protein [Anaerolineae bacterium]
MHQQSAWRETIVILFAVLSVTIYMLGAGAARDPGFPLDDAWIHQTYARNLAESGQWAFVPGEPSAGSTSPLYTLLLAAGYWLGAPFSLWAGLLGAGALAGAGLIAMQMGRRLGAALAPGRAARWVDTGAGLAVVLAWHMVWAGASGMETMLFGALTLGMVAVAWRELDDRSQAVPALVRRGMALGLLGAAAMLTRPEGAGLLGLIGLVMWAARPQDAWRGVLVWSGGVGLGWLAGFVPYALFNLSLGGSIFPGTASAKQAEYAVLLGLPYLQRVAALFTPILAGGQFLLLPGIAAGVMALGARLRRDRAALLLLIPIIWALALVLLYAARLPATYQHGRYVVPALPHLIVFGVAGTAYLSAWLQRRGMAGRVLGRALVLTVIVLYALFWGIGFEQYGRDVRIIQSEMVASARWIAATLPPDELLAVHDIGAVGYFAPRPILDLAGLVSPEVIPVIRDGAALWDLMAARDVRYLLAFPDQVPGQDADDPRLCPMFTTGAPEAIAAGGQNMTVYALAWDGNCP